MYKYKKKDELDATGVWVLDGLGARKPLTSLGQREPQASLAGSLRRDAAWLGGGLSVPLPSDVFLFISLRQN